MSTGFNFGAKSPAAPVLGQTNFGAQPTGGSITFGTPVAAPNVTTNTGFGLVGATASTPNFFGMTAPKTTNMAFGTPNTNLSFSTNQPTGINFAAPTSAAGMNFPLGGVSTSSVPFGAQTSTGGGKFLFGAPVSSAPSGLMFRTTPATVGFGNAPPSGAGMTFGTPASSTAAGVVSSTPALSFGSTGFTSGGGLTLGSTTTTAAPFVGLNFGTATTMTTAAPTLGLNFPTTPTLNFGGSTLPQTSFSLGMGTATTQSTGLSFGLGSTSTAFNLDSLKSSTTTTTSSIGLGGIATSTPTSGTTTSGKIEMVPRDQPLPNEILQTVDNFKSFIKQQKIYSSDVARCSVKEFKKVAADIDTVSNLLNEVEKQLQTNKATAEKLKYDTAKGLQHVEMAQRTFDTPPGLQYDNTAPLNFFIELVNNFERDLHNLKLHIENTDKYVKNMGKPMPLTSQDLALGMRKLHESFVVLAGRLQSVHTQVEAQKEQYLNMRKYMLNDDTNVFEKPQPQTTMLNIALNTISYKPPDLASGPTPFNSLSHPSVVQAAAQAQTPANISSSLSFGPSQVGPLFGSSAANTSLFGSSTGLGTTNFGQPSLQFNSPSTNFQLQKPPAGNKRWKQ